MTSTTTPPAPANPAATDEMLPSQPIGYWSGAAHEAVIRLIRDAMARIDVTQPQWWSLNRVVGAAGRDGATRAAVVADLASVADGPYEISRALDQLVHRGWLSIDSEERFTVTDSGQAAMGRIRELVHGLRDRVHTGVSDEDYVITLRVLRRMIENVETAYAQQS
ncbi:MarR family winged helix-turn-helix transcriptional regulator [Streptomyces bambusae]|uniref:MarR family transcriptional regulator n=1 Tax=Streptomyces bambusae TaxID=1550616 RepID=A0ABS6ZF68_9ACTN|nr:MarR family winged helix-turn-helix transcriptional regulator [Streptomyces bambusae]MBW5486241.1 MarR family transcriptional regulator [Streptomyces bambusae]